MDVWAVFGPYARARDGCMYVCISMYVCMVHVCLHVLCMFAEGASALSLAALRLFVQECHRMHVLVCAMHR